MAYALYDKATAPDRSAPDVAVDNYLRAALFERDAVVAYLFVCREPSLHPIDDLEAKSSVVKISSTLRLGKLGDAH